MTVIARGLRQEFGCPEMERQYHLVEKGRAIAIADWVASGPNSVANGPGAPDHHPDAAFGHSFALRNAGRSGGVPRAAGRTETRGTADLFAGAGKN